MSKKPETMSVFVPIAELTGEALNYAAAIAEGRKPEVHDGRPYDGVVQIMVPTRGGEYWYLPNVAAIIEGNAISVGPRWWAHCTGWEAYDAHAHARGSTLAEAVLRCFVASKRYGMPCSTHVSIPATLISH